MPPSEKPLSSSHEAFVRALTRHERVIRAYIRGAGIWRPEDVDEITQEVSLIAWQKFDQLRDVEEFPKWACVIARYQVLEFRRQRYRDRLVLNEDVFETLMDEALEETEKSEELLRRLELCLEELPAAGLKLINEVYRQGTSIDELARAVGKKANALYQHLWRLRQSLKKCMERAGAGPERSNPATSS